MNEQEAREAILVAWREDALAQVRGWTEQRAQQRLDAYRDAILAGVLAKEPCRPAYAKVAAHPLFDLLAVCAENCDCDCDTCTARRGEKP